MAAELPTCAMTDTIQGFLMVDLCSGLGGASAAMVDRGWKVVRVDINPEYNPTIVADVCEWSWRGPRPDLVWASPPCQEFSRWGMPWLRKKSPPQPDLSVVLACLRIIEEAQPRYWVIENVCGAVRFLRPLLGPPRKFGPFFLWGHFPDPGSVRVRHVKEKLPGRARAERARVPYELSLAIAVAVERQASFLLPTE